MAKKDKTNKKVERALVLARRQRRPVNKFRALLGEEGYARWVKEQREKARREEEYIASLPPAARARAQYARWWNSVGRFQKG